MVSQTLIRLPVVVHRLITYGFLGFSLSIVLSLPTQGRFASPSPPAASQIRPIVLGWLNGFSQDINLLSSRADSANWPHYRKVLQTQYGLTDTLSIPNLLRPAQLYQVIGGRLPAGVFLNRLSNYFYEGFQYHLDTTAAVIQAVQYIGSRCLITLTTPVRLHGLVDGGVRRTEVSDQQTFVLEGNYEKKKLTSLRFVSLRSDRSALPVGMADQLSIQKLITYQHQLLSGILFTALGDSTTVAGAESYQNLRRLLVSDTLWVRFDSVATQPIQLRELAKMNLSETQLATARISSFDITHVSRFYRDLDSQLYGEQVKVTGVCASLEQSRLYADRSTTVVRLPTGFVPPSIEYIRVSRVVLNLTR